MSEGQEEEKPRVDPDLKRLVDKLKDNAVALHISRVPISTKKEFIKLAEEEFCKDYGMTLKWLMDGLIKKEFRAIIQKIDELDARIGLLENKPPEKPQPKFRTMLSGRKIPLPPGKE